MAEHNHPEGGRELDNTPVDNLLDTLPDASSLDQKAASTDEKASALEIVNEKQAYLDPQTADSYSVHSDGLFVNGEPVISTGQDVSRFVVDLRDDGDPSLTFRSLVLGTVFAGLGAALYQVRSRSSYIERS